MAEKHKTSFFSLFFFRGEGSLYAYAPFTITFNLLPFYLFQYCVMYSRIDSNINGLHCFFFFLYVCAPLYNSFCFYWWCLTIHMCVPIYVSSKSKVFFFFLRTFFSV